MTRLSNADLSPAAQVRRSKLRPRIVHLGLGAFFKAHGALYTEDCGGAGDWGIVGASLQRASQRDAMQPQDFIYSATELSPSGSRTRLVGNILDVMVAPENPSALVERLANAETEIVSLTVTEKGYCHNPATGRLHFEHPAIVADLANRSQPQSAIGFLVAALDLRRQHGLGPFTVLSCDNLPGNGALLGGLVKEFAAAVDAGLASWITEHGAFPSSMVDRIVPAQSVAGLAFEDAAAVSHEPYRQWVLQDQFSSARPLWEEAGVMFVADVSPFEHAKLRMLNGAHSAIAYVGYLAGHETVADAVADPSIKGYIEALWQYEIMPTLTPPPALDLRDYAKALMVRFQNPSIRHRTWQIAMDGSQKLPQRLLGTVRDRLREGASIARLAFAVAAWLRYVEGVDERGQAIDVRDPMLALITARLHAAGADRVKAVLSLPEIFGEDLAAHSGFARAVQAAHLSICNDGVRRALAHLE